MKTFWIITILLQLALIFGYYWIYRDSGGEAWDILVTWLVIIGASVVFDGIAAVVCGFMLALRRTS